MLTSLFGELGSTTRPIDPSAEGAVDEQGFATTAILESVETEVNARGQMIERHLSDLVVAGSPAQAIREHFATTRADLDVATSMITLIDPVGIWASSVIKALSDAGGRPIERLHLREANTLSTLAMIERTTLVRRDRDTLRVFHADVRAPGAENGAIPIALMERSQMTVVIIGPMRPQEIDMLLGGLARAAGLPTWQCPNLLFQLPPSAAWIASKVEATAWPEPLRVHVLSEPMTGASSVWNAMLDTWDRVRLEPARPGAAEPATVDGAEFPISVGEPDDGAAGAVRAPRRVLDPARDRLALAGMARLDGLLGCAVVDATSGLVLAREVGEGDPLDVDRAAAACARMLQTQRQAAVSIGLDDPIDELITTTGARHLLVRPLARHADLFLMALLDKNRTNLALARIHLSEVERTLV